MRRPRTAALALGLSTLAVCPVVVRAQEQLEESGGGSALFSLNVGLMFWTWVLFLLTMGILGWKVFPAISGGLEERHAKIQGAIDEAHQARDDAKSMLAERRSALEDARSQAKEMLDKARAAAEGTRKDILADAKAQQEAFLADARRELDQERDRLREDLRRETVDISLAVAERLMRTRLDAEENRRLVEEFVAEL